MPVDDTKEFLTISDLMAKLNISRMSAYRLTRQKDFKTVKILGRVYIRPSDLDEYCKNHTMMGGEQCDA